MAVAWHPDVNKKAYGMDTAPMENVERVEFESGKARTFLKNTAAKKTHSFMLKMDDVGDNSEYKKFVAWWEYTLLGGSLSFYFPDLITMMATRSTGLSEHIPQPAKSGKRSLLPWRKCERQLCETLPTYRRV